MLLVSSFAVFVVTSVVYLYVSWGSGAPCTLPTFGLPGSAKLTLPGEFRSSDRFDTGTAASVRCSMWNVWRVCVVARRFAICADLVLLVRLCGTGILGVVQRALQGQCDPTPLPWRTALDRTACMQTWRPRSTPRHCSAPSTRFCTYLERSVALDVAGRHQSAQCSSPSVGSPGKHTFRTSGASRCIIRALV